MLGCRYLRYSVDSWLKVLVVKIGLVRISCISDESSETDHPQQQKLSPLTKYLPKDNAISIF